MNILNFLIKDTHVAGVEISDKAIRIAYFHPIKRFGNKIHYEKTKLPEHELVMIEESLPANVIKEGVVANKELLGKTLKDIWGRARLNANCAIVAIPENKIYSRIFPFPKTVNQSEMEEAIKLAVNFQLPVKKSEMNIGYENASDSNLINEILISAIPKPVANDYVWALNYAGIKILALESHLASIARSIKLNLDQTALFVKKGADGATIFIVKDGIMRFSRMYPSDFMYEDFLAKEAEHIKTSWEFDKKISVTALPLEEAGIRDEYLRYPKFKEADPAVQLQSKWLIAVGAAIRGEIPKGADNRISLLPIGTAEAFTYQKTMAFTALIRNMTISIALFFLLAFGAAYLFIFSLSQTAGKTNSNILIPLTSPDILQKEELVKRTNLTIKAGRAILSNTLNWSILLDDIKSRVVGDIIITNFSLTSMNDPISIVGIAKDRDTLNEFKKSLQASPYLTSVELPITNLEKKADIPFSISLRLGDMKAIYYK